MLAPIYRHRNCGSESAAPVHDQGVVGIPGDPGACVPALVPHALQSVCDWVLLVPTREVQSRFWAMSIILSQG